MARKAALTIVAVMGPLGAAIRQI